MAYDIASELRKEVGRLKAILAELDEIQPPELVRPDVPHGKPATEELIRWASQVYVYSIVCHFREILRSTLILYDGEQVAAVFLCIRALFEMAAHVYYVGKHVFQHLDGKDFDAAWKFMVKVNAGSRYMMEKYAEQLNGKMELEESPKIQKAVAAFNEYFKERENAATEEYSFLSEFCHPNSFAFTNHLDWQNAEKPVEGMKVTFARPTMDMLIQVIPSAVISTTAVVVTCWEILSRLGDYSLRKALHEVDKITASWP